MSKTIFIRIQDDFQFDMVKDPKHVPGGPFPKMPVNEIPAHQPFEIALDYSHLPGADTWHTQMQGLLPVDSGIWEFVENSVEHPYFHFGNYVSIKTSKKQGAKEFLILGNNDPYNSWDSIFSIFSGPLIGGLLGDGKHFKNMVPGGILNRFFKWKLTRII
jgi:hypothetical protein